LFHRFDWSKWTVGTPQDRLSLLPAAQEHILAQEDGKNRLLRTVAELSKASDEVIDIFAAAGLKKPDISILSDGFLAEVQGSVTWHLRKGLGARFVFTFRVRVRSQGFTSARTSARGDS
jgi:hypothetical protein